MRRCESWLFVHVHITAEKREGKGKSKHTEAEDLQKYRNILLSVSERYFKHSTFLVEYP